MHIAFEGRMLLVLELTRREDALLFSVEVAVKSQFLTCANCFRTREKSGGVSFWCESVSGELLLPEGKTKHTRSCQGRSLTATLAELANSLSCICTNNRDHNQYYLTHETS